LSLFDSTTIQDNADFIHLYTQFRADIARDGILETLKKIG
jgi:hypothetical protein